MKSGGVIAVAVAVAMAVVWMAGAVSSANADSDKHGGQKMTPVVETDSGKVRGRIERDLWSFKGIPFAAPPVGERRWREPEPPEPWKGVRDTTAFGADCMQIPFPSDAAPLGTEPAEDCLYVNVWRPADTDPQEPLPVLVWIYGGGFVNGGASPDVYEGAEFARRGLIFVSFNYRLGRFGYFAHPALKAEADSAGMNFGLMDQQAALRWVQRNISAFGGNPDQVTIMGESAGGMSITSLIGSPEARGLFHRAIIMSGGGRSSGPMRRLDEDLPGLPSAQTVGRNFARAQGIKGEGEPALKALRALSAEQVAGDLNLATLFSGAQEEEPTWTRPFVDHRTLVDSSEALFASGKHAKVPLMVGATSADIGFLSAVDKEALFAQFGELEARARKVFDPQGDRPLSELTATIGRLRMMVEPARYLAQSMTEAGQPAWHYRFSYVAQAMRDEWDGAPHATEIPYAFNTVSAKYEEALTPPDVAMANWMHAYFANFARRGDPNGPGLLDWAAYDAQHEVMLNFTLNEGVTAGADPWQAQLDLVKEWSEQGK